MQDKLSERLKEETRQAHRAAERSGIVGDLIRGKANRRLYLLYIKNLGEVYSDLEHVLDALEDHHPLRFFADPALFRHQAIEQDFRTMCGPDSPTDYSSLEVTGEYRQSIFNVAQNRNPRLLAHAYVRYMGDLSGGQILSDVLKKSGFTGGEACHSTKFYEFPDIADAGEYKDKLRTSMDALALSTAEMDLIVAEANKVFQLNMRLSDEVSNHSG